MYRNSPRNYDPSALKCSEASQASTSYQASLQNSIYVMFMNTGFAGAASEIRVSNGAILACTNSSGAGLGYGAHGIDENIGQVHASCLAGQTYGGDRTK
jgi:hypothetical protein